MDPHYLLIEDFMSHRRTEIDCTKFDSALIVGQDKSNPRESNGVGKSVIYHAIKYALFGTYPTSVVDKIIVLPPYIFVTVSLPEIKSLPQHRDKQDRQPHYKCQQTDF